MSSKNDTLFSVNSELYAGARPVYPAELFSYLSSLCKGDERAWDCAAGSGQAAIGLSAHFNEVKATDISREQIANSFSHSRVEYSVQPAEKTDFADNSFDLVCVAQALHWFKYDKFYPEVKRVLKPGGIFAAWGYSWPLINEQIDSIIEEKVLKVLRPYWAEENKLLWDGYRDVPFPFLELEPPPFVLKINWSCTELFNYMRSWSAGRLCIEELGEAPFKEAQLAAAALYGAEGEKREVKMNLFLRVGEMAAIGS